MAYILRKRLKFYTKESLKIINIILIALFSIITIVMIKFKPSYEVSILEENVGFVENKDEFEKKIENYVENYSAKNVDSVELLEKPKYKLKLIEKTKSTNEDEIIIALQKNMKINYKYYEIALGDEVIETVDTKENAEKIISEIKEENLKINEKTTDNIEEIKISDIQIAKNNILNKLGKTDEVNKETNSIGDINGIKIASIPVKGTITSRYGVSSRIRVSTHTGLDIATKTGTPIKVIAEGTVISAKYEGSYGNIVKVDHGNGVESWYAHTSKMYVSKGQKVSAGDTIAAVGSTGNSTGPHLHLEIRINGEHVNPQKYLYR